MKINIKINIKIKMNEEKLENDKINLPARQCAAITFSGLTAIQRSIKE